MKRISMGDMIAVLKRLEEFDPKIYRETSVLAETEEDSRIGIQWKDIVVRNECFETAAEEFIDLVRVQRAKSSTLELNGWKPIETAPRLTPVLVWIRTKSDKEMHAVAWLDEFNLWSHEGSPIAWRELPEPPVRRSTCEN